MNHSGSALPTSTERLYMGKGLKEILEAIEPHLVLVEQEIQERIRTGVPLIDASAAHLFLAGGKRIRASLVVLTSGLRGDPPEGIIKLAAAAEIVHAASLIHDDIIDQSIIRRGSPTVPHQWGNKVAVLAGDFLYSVALTMALEDGDAAIFPLMVAGTKDMVMGELFQIAYSTLESATRDTYLAIVKHKTAQFMGTCARIGGIKAGLAEREIDLLYDFGLNLGFAFQIIDDTLDIIRDTNEIGKDTANDFKDGKITLPFIFLLERGDKRDIDLLKQYLHEPSIERWECIRERLKETGGIEYALETARGYIDRARACLEPFPNSTYATALYELSEFIIKRNY